ncbi:VanZ family protein [Agarilytica rhodophyticola]|uniref:VanZ family protein n=1 Tax=Agarilytica rhodophyticola TaxID=1737490 RepID=UPI000B34740E|nr:VanZ family protein [Agarilytica rhodophyticola]
MQLLLLQILRFIFQNPIFKVLRIFQFLLAIGIFFTFALMPVNNTPSNIPPAALHFTGNLLLITSAWVALLEYLKTSRIFILSAVLSLCSELAQSLTTTRITDPMDLGYNLIGLSVGVLICFMLNYLLNTKHITVLN